MKKLISGIMLTGAIALASSNVQAQDTTTTAGEDIKNAAKKTGKAIGKGAKKVADKTAELASKGKAGVVDKVYEGKYGPDDQTIYINSESKYYWVDKKGHRHFIAEEDLKDEKGL